MKKLVFGIAIVITLAMTAYLFFTNKSVEVVQNNNFLEKFTREVVKHQPIELQEKIITLDNGAELNFRIPSGYNLQIAAEDLGKVRFMTWSPDGRLFVPDIVNYQLSHEGRLFVLEDFNEETGRFETKHTYLSGLRGPNSVAFYTDENGQDWLYLALTAHLVRYPYTAGDTEPSGEAEIVAEFPNEQSPGEVSVVWHITRTIFFHEGRVYVSVGSGCNSCEELAGEMRAMIYSMNPDGSDKRIEGEGLRNTVGITMAGNELYATANGVDHLGNNAPDEMLYKVEDGKHYGWPYCYVEDGQYVADNSQTWNNPLDCSEITLPVATFKPRSAPLGLRYFNDSFHHSLADSFLVALHGSFDPSVSSGYEIRRVTKTGQQELFMDGFLQNGKQIARPVDFLQFNDKSFFFTDDHGGRIFFLKAEG